MTCPPIDTLQRFALGFLEDEAPVRAHVAACAACAKRMTALDADHAALAAAAKDVVLPKLRRPASRPALWKPLAAAAGLLLAFGVYQLTATRGAAPAALPAPAMAVRPSAPRQPRPTAEESYEAARSELRLRYAMDSERSAPPVEAPVTPAPPPAKMPEAKPEPPAATTFRAPGFNPGVDTAKETQSTFALDVDTASYAVARSYLQRGMRPPPESVRVEEYVNYFRYGDPAPPADAGFLVRLEAAPSPFAKGKHLLRIGVRAKDVDDAARKDAVLTFVIDVSGSMQQENRLGLVKRSLHHLVDRLRPTDRVALVVYGSTAREVLTACASGTGGRRSASTRPARTASCSAPTAWPTTG
jgi:Ca-activated chloride channel family protein